MVADAVSWQEDARPADAQRSIHISRRAQNGRNPFDREVGHHGLRKLQQPLTNVTVTVVKQ